MKDAWVAGTEFWHFLPDEGPADTYRTTLCGRLVEATTFMENPSHEKRCPECVNQLARRKEPSRTL